MEYSFRISRSVTRISSSPHVFSRWTPMFSHSVAVVTTNAHNTKFFDAVTTNSTCCSIAGETATSSLHLLLLAFERLLTADARYPVVGGGGSVGSGQVDEYRLFAHFMEETPSRFRCRRPRGSASAGEEKRGPWKPIRGSSDCRYSVSPKTLVAEPSETHPKTCVKIASAGFPS